MASRCVCSLWRVTLLSAAPECDVDQLASQAALDALEAVVRQTVESEVAWLQAQLNRLEQALHVLRLSGVEAAPGDGRLARVESTLQQVTIACRERLAALADTTSTLRSG